MRPFHGRLQRAQEIGIALRNSIAHGHKRGANAAVGRPHPAACHNVSSDPHEGEADSTARSGAGCCLFQISAPDGAVPTWSRIRPPSSPASRWWRSARPEPPLTRSRQTSRRTSRLLRDSRDQRPSRPSGRGFAGSALDRVQAFKAEVSAEDVFSDSFAVHGMGLRLQTIRGVDTCPPEGGLSPTLFIRA